MHTLMPAVSKCFHCGDKPLYPGPHRCCTVWQVHVVAKSEYVIPEGNRVKAENSRRTERKKEFPPRHMLREQFERDVATAAVTAQPA